MPGARPGSGFRELRSCEWRVRHERQVQALIFNGFREPWAERGRTKLFSLVDELPRLFDPALCGSQGGAVSS